MNGAFELAKKVGIVMFVVITIITMASAAPLEIRIEEKVNTTVEPEESTLTGEIQFKYTTNVTGYVNITNTGNDPIYDVWIALNLTNVTGNCVLSVNNTLSAVNISNSASGFVPDRINKAGVFNTSGANCFVHIPLLNTSGSVSIFYDVNDNAMGIDNGAPFDISERYNPSKIPVGGNYTWTVYFNVSLNDTWWANTALGSLSGNNVTLNIKKYLSNNSNHYGSPNWTYLNLSSCYTTKGSCNIFDSPYSDATNTDAFNVTNIVLNITNSNSYVNVTFNVTGNYTNSSAAPYYIAPFGFAVFEFNLSYGNISGSYVVDVFAIGNASINVTKEGPYYNSSGYTWWRGNVTITNKASGLSYVVTNVTMWATNQSSFSNYVYGSFNCSNSAGSIDGNVICEYNSSNSNLPWVLNSAESVTLPGSSDWMNFSYDKVPIIWANATFKLIKDSNKGWGTNNTTSNDYNVTYGSNFIVIEKIYIIGTYLVKVTKHVLYNSSASSPENGSVFDIYLVVENIGGNVSPYVYVYDLIPTNFSEFNWNDTWTDTGKDGNWVNNSSMLAGNGSQDLSGIYSKGYWWRLMPLNGGADGNGSYEDWSEIAENKTVVIFYQLNGTGDFRVLDVFIVGIDPMYSLNEQTSPKITLVSGAKATNYESTLAAAVFAAIGTAALIVRRNGRR
jgi:hypothetical protein